MPRPRLTDKEFDLWKTIRDNDFIVEQLSLLQQECDQAGIPVSDVKHYWYKSDRFSIFAKNPENPVNEVIDRFDELVQKYSSEKITPIERERGEHKRAIKATTTDDHVGLEPNPDGNALFQYEYNADIYRKSMDRVFNSIMDKFETYGKFDFLLLDNLGDQEDGWHGETVRGGHELPQNMTAGEVFDTVVDKKVNQITNLANAGVADKIILRKCVNDNHSGDFGYLINKAIQKIINGIFQTDYVEIQHLKRFMEHRFYGDHCFILTHGKDKKHMRSGLPLKLNDKTKNFISEYIEHYGIDSKYIHVEKGDLHQIGYDKTPLFDYRNYMSFAPPSAYQQTNYGDSYAGYSIQVIPKYSNEIAHTNYFLEYRKKRCNKV